MKSTLISSHYEYRHRKKTEFLKLIIIGGGYAGLSALRKGKAAVNNILLEAGILRFCLPYMHQDIGYLLS